MKKIGIDMGTSSIKIAVLENGGIAKEWCKDHHGSLLKTLQEGLIEIDEDEAELGVTGSDALILRDYMEHVPVIEMIPALVEGVRQVCPMGRSIIDIGSQGSRFISDAQSAAPSFHANEHCAGGTGAFFEDQMERLGMKIEDYSREVMKAEKVPQISGRCAVFAKTDIIHRQQEGIETPDILNGLCYALVRNYRAVIMRSLPLNKPVVFTGGVTLNAGMKRALMDVLKLEEKDLIVPAHARTMASIGAALLAKETVSLKELQKKLASTDSTVLEKAALPQLKLEEGVSLKDPGVSELDPEKNLYLGIDIGSTSTDLVIMAEDGSLIDYQYLRTAGDPERAVRSGLSSIQERFGNLKFKAVGITGSGRERIGRMIGADVIRDEITAQAEGAASIIPDVDTVFEIGGQDSKYISMKDGHVVDFQMNKICAAGTGSFVEEQASRMNIPLAQFGEMAMQSKTPAVLGERCTVFIQTSINTAMGQGASAEDISAGLAYSIVRNYLEKVVGEKKVGNRIVLQGGVCYNPSIVAAFEAAYPGKTTVSPYFSISGAYGVCMLAKKAGIEASTFKGFDFDSTMTGSTHLSDEIQKNKEFFHRSEKMLLEGYTGKIDPQKKTVGIPYVLLMHHFFPMAFHFFSDLGFNVILTKPTDADTIHLSQEKAVGETCYPVKLMFGHIQQLIDMHVDYIFMPLVHTMKHEKSTVKYNYGCMYMQSAAKAIEHLLHAQDQHIQLLNPVLDLDMGKQEMAKAMAGMAVQMGFSKPRAMKALMTGAMAFRKYNAAVEKQGQEMLASLKPDEKVFVIVTRPYGIADPVLNMQIPDLLLERGKKVITMENLPGHDVDLSEDYPDLYWPFGQHIISAAKMIYKNPNLYAIYLTNHGCGPDTMLMHMFAEEMKDKPYLQIEVDEQYSSVGVITRIEAFLNSIETRKTEKLPENYNILDVDHNHELLSHQPDPDRMLAIPYMGIYSELIKVWMEKEYGVECTILPPYTKDVLSLGRTITRTKEYLPFAAFAGEILMEEKNHPGEKQYFIPSTLGSEADGQYVRAIRSALNEKGMENVPLFTETIEEVPAHHKACMDLLLRVLAGDLISNALPSDRETMLAYIRNQGETTNETIHSLATMMHQFSAKPVGIVGTPLVETALNEGVLDKLETDGRILLKAPLSEYLIFLWEEEPSNAVQSEELKKMRSLLQSMHAYSAAFTEDMNALHALADKHLGKVNGGNIRYRFAKAIQLSSSLSGLLLASPRYENADMLMSMHEVEKHCTCPVHHLSFDGDWDEGAAERLGSFLYYCR